MKCTVITKCNKKIDKRQAVETYLKINVTFSKSFQALNTPKKRDVLACKITLRSHQTNWLPCCQIQASLRVEPY